MNRLTIEEFIASDLCPQGIKELKHPKHKIELIAKRLGLVGKVKIGRSWVWHFNSYDVYRICQEWKKINIKRMDIKSIRKTLPAEYKYTNSKKVFNPQFRYL